MTATRGLLRRVARVRRRALVLGICRAALAGCAGLSLGPLLSAAVLPWLSQGSRAGAVWGFAALGLAGAAALATWEGRRSRPLRSVAEAARLLAAGQPALGGLVETGADLAGWGEGGAEARGASTELAEAQVEEAARAADGMGVGTALPLRDALPAALGAVLPFLLLMGLWNLNPGGAADAWRAFAQGKPPRPVTVGNLRLLIDPPAYTGLGRSVLEGVGGAVEALRGSRVTLEGQLSEPVDRGRWEGSDGRVSSLEVSGHSFRATWVLERPGTYSLAFERGSRRVPSDFPPQPVTLRPDERPRVELSIPSSDLEVVSNAEVEVRFTASDDFRVDRAEIVLQGEVEARIPVRIVPGQAVEGVGRFLPLAFPKLGAGAALRVEAWDSDNVSGPKAGASRSVYVTFLDRKRVLGDIEALGDRLFEALLGHLADQLESPAPTGAALERLRGRAADLLRLFESLAARVRQGAEDGIGAAAVLKLEDGLRQALGPFAEGKPPDQEGIVAELERDVLLLDRLLKNLQMEETLSMGDELSSLQRSLFDELQAGKNPRDLLSRVDQIQRLLGKMMQKLSRDAGEMPDAFANADAFKDAPTDELQEQLAQLRKALEAGDREAARKAAEKLLATLSRWMEALEGAAEGSASKDSDPALKDLARMESEVRGLMGEQEQILQDTRSLSDDVSKRTAETLKKELQSLAEREEQRLAVISDLARRTESLGQRGMFHEKPPSTPSPEGQPPKPSALDLFEAANRVSSSVNDVRQALRGELGRAGSAAQELEQSFQSLRDAVGKSLEPGDERQATADRYQQQARTQIRALMADLQNLEEQRRKAMGRREQEQAGELREDQEDLGRRTEGLSDKLGELTRKTPFAGTDLPAKARSSGASMNKAGEKLGRGNPFGAVPLQGRALEDLSEIAKQISQARRQLSQGKGAGGFQMMGQSRPGENGREPDRSRVEIPKEAQAQEFKAFREEVLKAMRRKEYPKNYEDEVERYFERLIR